MMNSRNASGIFHFTGRTERARLRARRGAELMPRVIAVCGRSALITLVVVSSLAMVWSSRALSHSSAMIAATESVGLFANQSGATPKTLFNLGENVWAIQTGAPIIPGFRQRRFQWVAPDGTVAQQADVTMEGQPDLYTIPTTGPFAQIGTWSVKTVDNSNVGFAFAQFVVRDPANVAVDLSVNVSGPSQVAAGNNISYSLRVINNGPDDAQNVEVTDTAPGNANFLSLTEPPGWSCTGSSTINCSTGSLARGATATFTLVYQIDDNAPASTAITNTASVSSQTTELHTPDNSSTATSTVTASPCTLGCPGNISSLPDAGMSGATVTYADPTTSGSCETVTCNPPSGSFFSAGATTVVCSSQNGAGCSFTVTVTGTVAITLNGANPMAVECHTDFEDPGATAQDGGGDSVPVTASGTVDANTPGTYTITYTATGASPVTRTVEVVDTTGPAITACATNKTLTPDNNNQAVLPNLIPEVVAADSCSSAPPVITQFPAAGTLIGVGATAVTLTATDPAGNASSCTAFVTVSVDFYLHGAGSNNNPATLFIDNTAPTATTDKFKDSTAVNFNGGNPWKEVGTWAAAPGQVAGTLASSSDLRVWLGLKNSDDQGTRFDLRVEVYVNDAPVGEGETYCITGLTRNPAQAQEVVLAFAPFTPVTLNGTSDQLKLKISTRIGSNDAGSFCGGHSNAVGLRLYFDTVSKPARFNFR